MKRILVVGLFVSSFVLVSTAATRELEKGPPAKVSKKADKHLFQIYVVPPKASNNYKPGDVTIYLKREYPDYMYVPLKHKIEKDGRLHVQIAISPEKESTYTINVLDEQADGEILLLYSNALAEIGKQKP